MGNFHEIRQLLEGDDQGPWFVIHRGTKIVGLCLREDLNPKIKADPPEVWVGAEAPLPEWGDRLANDTGPIPVYVAPGERGDYVLKGTYEVSTRQATPAELVTAQAKSPRGVSRIVFLQTA